MSSIFEYRDEDIFFHHSIDYNPKDNDFQIHIHEQYEIFYFISGDATFLVEGNEYPLTDGDLLIMRNSESHKIKILSDKTYERFSLHFNPDILSTFDTENILLLPFLNRSLGSNNLYKISEFKDIQPIELFKCMCENLDYSVETKLNIMSNLYPLLNILRKSFKNKSQQNISNTKLDVAKQLVDYINDHLYSDLSLDILSKHFFLSSSQLSKIFKKSTGSSIWEYIVIKRLLSAKSKIKSGVCATTACAECGFKDYSSFYRAYIKHFKNPPNQDKNNT